MFQLLSIQVIATLGVLGTAAMPVTAAPSAKPIEVTISSKVFATPASRMCMPKAQIGKHDDKSLPKTMCLTRAEWEAMGVTFKVK